MMAGCGPNCMQVLSDNLTQYIIAGEGERAGGITYRRGEQIGLHDPASRVG